MIHIAWYWFISIVLAAGVLGMVATAVLAAVGKADLVEENWHLQQQLAEDHLAERMVQESQ